MDQQPTPDLPQQVGDLLGRWPELWGQLGQFLDTVFRPWVAYQIAIAALVLAVAALLRHWIAPRLYDWMRSRENWPKWRLRVLVVVHRRLRMVLFVLLIWTVVLVMREATWPSRSYFLAIIANLATAWLIVAFATRLIANTLLRSVVRYGAWAWVTLRILDLGGARAHRTVQRPVAVHAGADGQAAATVFFQRRRRHPPERGRDGSAIPPAG